MIVDIRNDEAVLDCQHDWLIEHVGENSETSGWVARCINCQTTASPAVINDYMAESDAEYIKLCIEKDKWNRRQYSWRKWGRRRLYEIKKLRAELANSQNWATRWKEAAKKHHEYHRLWLDCNMHCHGLLHQWIEQAKKAEADLAELKSRSCKNCRHDPCGSYWLEYCSEWEKEEKDE